MRRFVLRRTEDETGVSGTGDVAQGVEFDDGSVALRWATAWPTSVVFHDKGIEGVEAIHGHGGKTRVVWLDPDPTARCYCGHTAFWHEGNRGACGLTGPESHVCPCVQFVQGASL